MNRLIIAAALAALAATPVQAADWWRLDPTGNGLPERCDPAPAREVMLIIEENRQTVGTRFERTAVYTDGKVTVVQMALGNGRRFSRWLDTYVNDEAYCRTNMLKFRDDALRYFNGFWPQIGPGRPASAKPAP